MVNVVGALLTVGGKLDQGALVMGELFGKVLSEHLIVMVFAVGVTVTVGVKLDHVG